MTKLDWTYSNGFYLIDGVLDPPLHLCCTSIKIFIKIRLLDLAAHSTFKKSYTFAYHPKREEAYPCLPNLPKQVTTIVVSVHFDDMKTVSHSDKKVPRAFTLMIIVNINHQSSREDPSILNIMIIITIKGREEASA